jgi:hypothetical protein
VISGKERAARFWVATVAVILVVIAVWKFIDWRTQPPPPPNKIVVPVPAPFP